MKIGLLIRFEQRGTFWPAQQIKIATPTMFENHHKKSQITLQLLMRHILVIFKDCAHRRFGCLENEKILLTGLNVDFPPLKGYHNG